MNENCPTDETVGDVQRLEELLSEPTEEVVAAMGRLEGDLLILGVGGKMGPTVAQMARRASDAAGANRKIIGVYRSITPEVMSRLESSNIELIHCDMLDQKQLDALPDSPNVVYMAAKKFGSTGDEYTTWAANVFMPGTVCRRYASSRIVAFSTGNVYKMVPADSQGSTEDSPLEPLGDYAMSALGRERMFEYFSITQDMPVAMLRLNYSCELRYGVLVDLAMQVLAEKPIDVTMGHFNVIWQGDANAMTLRALEHTASPMKVINVAGPEILSIRQAAEQFGELLGKPVSFTGSEAPTAFLNNGDHGRELLGRPRVPVERLIGWIADWQARGGPTLGKPTKFQVRDGKF